MRWAEAALRRYQRQMGALEMPEWEQTVERRSARCYGGAPRKSAKPPTGLIDLDLVRGSTFPKAKSPQGLWFAVRQGVLRAALLPLYSRWWCRHVGGRLFVLLLAAYAVYMALLLVYCTAEPDNSIPLVSPAELLTPLLVAFALSILKSQIVAFNETHMSGGGGKAVSSARLKRRSQTRPSSVPSSVSSNGPCVWDSVSTSSALPGQAADGGPEPPPACPAADLTRSSSSCPTQATSCGDLLSSGAPGHSQAVQAGQPGLSDRRFQHESEEFLPGSAGLAGGPGSSPQGRPGRSASHDLSPRPRPPPPPPRSLSVDSPPLSAPPAAARLAARHRRKLVRIADRPETVRCYHTDSTDDSKSDGEFSAGSSTSAVSKAAQSGGGGPRLAQGRCGNLTDSSAAEMSCSERHASDRDGGQRRSFVKAAQRRLAAGRRRCRRWTAGQVALPDPPSSADSHVDVSPNQQTSGSDSDASYTSGASATSGQRETAFGVTENPLQASAAVSDRTGCTIWEGAEVKKVDLSTLDICSVIVNRVESMPQSTDYLCFGLMMAALISVLPSLCRLSAVGSLTPPPAVWSALRSLPALANVTARLPGHLVTLTDRALGDTARGRVVTVGCLLVTLLVTSLLFFMLSVVERSFKQRLLYAKYFCYLTSARRARKFELPHFRLKKVRNIKTWLTVRSCLKKRGPQRSIDTLVSAACVTTVVLVTLLCVELLENSDSPRIDYYRIQLVVWCFSLGVYLVRVMSLGSYINRKYRNLSVVLTEQINLYLQIEQKPHKKERLVLANNVLKLASDLLKELESPFTVMGFSANPFLYNCTKVIVLSACSGVLSDMLGFKLKLYKIKLR